VHPLRLNCGQAVPLHDGDHRLVADCLADGRQLGVPLAYFPHLLRATPAQREEYVISGGGTGLHWDNLDEDISVPALLMGISDRTRKAS